jgi:hypothetical protein
MPNSTAPIAPSISSDHKDLDIRPAKESRWNTLFGMHGLFRKHHYTPVASDGHEVPPSAHDAFEDGERLNQKRWAMAGQLLRITAIILLSMAAGALAYAFTRPRGLPDSDWITCGHSVEEALAKNCQFDIMMNGWVPQECYHRNLSEEYIAQHQEFRFFADHLGYKELTLDDVRKGQFKTLFTTRNHHYAHCAYVWELQGIAIAGGPYIDEHSMNLEHTKHCAGLLLRSHEIMDEHEVGNGSRVPQIVEIGFMRCRAMW